MFVPNRFVAVAALTVVTAACARTPSTENSGAQASGTPPATSTPAPGTAAELRGTTWLLTTLGDKAITATDTARAAQLILRPDSKQVNGSGGCNRMFGVYELNGDALRFSGIGSTKMACQSGMDTETAFLPALLRVAKYRIDGQQLELSDSTGAVIARFAAKAK